MRLAVVCCSLILLAPAVAQETEVKKERAFAEREGMGVASMPVGRPQLIDIDGDGWLDLVVPNSSAPGTLRIYRSLPGRDGRRVFVDWTARSGLDQRPDGSPGRQHSNIVWGDLDGDGRLDAISLANQEAPAWAKDPQEHLVFRGLGGGRFAPLPGSGIERRRHRTTTAAVLADLDRDGRLDAVFGNSYARYGASLAAQPMRAFRNLGAGARGLTFRESTAAWGLTQRSTRYGDPRCPRPLYGLTACDLDRDGRPDLLGAAYGRQWNTAWLWDAERGGYRNQAAALGIDGDSVRHGRYPAWMQEWWTRRFGRPRQTEPPFRSNGNTFALVPADVDGDGDLDLFSAEITHAWAGEASDLSALLISRLAQGERRFVRQLEQLEQPDPQSGLRWRARLGLHRDLAPQQARRWNQGDLGAHWADLDQDGRLDLIVCESDYPHQRLRVWLQVAPLQFRESARELGLDWPNCPSLALGDVDRDGDLDLVVSGTRRRWSGARPRARLAVFENRKPRGGFLNLLLVGDGETASTSAIGARVVLRTEAGGQQTRELLGPYGHGCAQRQPGELHFGLGAAESASLTVIWPDAKQTKVTLIDVPANRWVVIRQGKDEPEILASFDAKRWRVDPDAKAPRAPKRVARPPLPPRPERRPSDIQPD